jgi:hypothetical protein
MSYDAVCEQVKSLPEACLADVSKYIDFVLYQYAQSKMSPLIESNEVFERNLQNGLNDIKNGQVTPLNEAFSEIKSRFA